jgi:hypothetical protein
LGEHDLQAFFAILRRHIKAPSRGNAITVFCFIAVFASTYSYYASCGVLFPG